jgi:SWIB/MDM2 domain
MSIYTPVTVSRELSTFLHLKEDEKISRSDATKMICDYIKLFGLRSPDDSTVIIPDKALSDLLHYTEYQKKVAAGQHFWNRNIDGVYKDVLETNDKLTYFNIQYLLKDHFGASGIHEHNSRRSDLGLEKVDTLPNQETIDEINNRWLYRIGGKKYIEALNSIQSPL